MKLDLERANVTYNNSETPIQVYKPCNEDPNQMLREEWGTMCFSSIVKLRSNEVDEFE